MTKINRLIPGQLNPGATLSNVYRAYSTTTDPVKALNKMMQERVTEETQKDVTIFRTAVCLKVVNSYNSPNFDSTSKFSFHDRQKSIVYGLDGTAPLELICAVPDLDAHCAEVKKLPNQAGKGGDIDAIEKGGYKTYYSISSDLPVPKPGDLVRVRIDNYMSPTQTNWYLGLDERNKVPVSSQESGIDMIMLERCRGDFCGKQFTGEVLEKYNATVSWKDEIILKNSIDVSANKGAIPRGKGVFTGAPTLAKHPIKLAQDVNLSWICFSGVNDFASTLDVADASKFVKAYHEKGIRTYILGYPKHGSEAAFANKILELADDTKALGIVVDFTGYVPPRTDLTSIKIRNDALYLYTTVFNLAKEKGYSVGITVSNILEKGNLPWKEFASKSIKPDFIIPQILATNSRQEMNDGGSEFLQPGDDATNGDLVSDSGALRKNEFINTFNIFKNFGYKNIVPGLGMLGSSPDPIGWKNYNLMFGPRTKDKPPLASRYDIKWAFESLADDLNKPNAIIWYDWENINFHSSKWAEKRWDLIKELGDAQTIAEKFNSIESSNTNIQMKSYMKTRRLDIYLNDTVEEFKNFINSSEKYINRDNSFIPNKQTIDAIDPFTEYPTLSKEQEEILRKDISDLMTQLQNNEEQIATFSQTISAMGVALSERGLNELYNCLDKSEEELSLEINTAAEALRQAQEYQDFLRVEARNKQEVLNAQEITKGPKEKKPTADCLKETVPDASSQTGLSNSDAKKGGTPRRAPWPAELNNIDFSRFEAGGDRRFIIDKWTKQTPRILGFSPIKINVGAYKKGKTEKIKQYGILLICAAEVMQRYWKTVLGPEALVFIGSNLRGNSKNHVEGAAIDFEVRYKDASNNWQTVPHLYTWAVTRYLMGDGAKRLPKGKTGMYLNVNVPGTPSYIENNPIGIESTNFNKQGKQVYHKIGNRISPNNKPWWKAPGGNTGVHYDIAGKASKPIAGFHRGSAPGYGGRGYYIFLNTDGQASSEIQSTSKARKWLKEEHPNGIEILNFIDAWIKAKEPLNFPGFPHNIIPANEYVPNWNQLLGLEPWEDQVLVAGSG